MPFGPYRGTLIYQIQSARVLLDALGWPVCRFLTETQRAAIESQLLIADQTTLHDPPDERDDSALLDHVERCRSIVSSHRQVARR